MSRCRGRGSRGGGARRLQSGGSVTEPCGQGAGAPAVGRCGAGLWEEEGGQGQPGGSWLLGRADEVPVSPFILEETARRAWALGPGLRPMCLRYWVEECVGEGSPKLTEPWGGGAGGPTNYAAGRPGNPGCA